MRRAVAVALSCLMFIAVACGQNTNTKWGGTWTRSECSCSNALPNMTCSDLWDNSYTVVSQGGPGQYFGPKTNGQNLVFGVDNSGQTQMTYAGYVCNGVLNKQVTCYQGNFSGPTACQVTFYCQSGDCVTSIIQQNMRSIMYPVMAVVLGAAWFVWPLIGGLVPPKLLSIIITAVLFGASIFIVIVPPFYHAVLLMAVASYAFNAIKAGGPWEIKVATFMAIFAFLLMIGFNVLAGASGSVPFFELVINGFNSDACFLALGEIITMPRCAQYTLFVLFVGFLVTLLLPMLVISLLWLLVQEENGK